MMNSNKGLTFALMILSIYGVLGLVFHSYADQQHYYRDFWFPHYAGQPLDYCFTDKQQCGAPVANRYCQMMGYEQASHHSIRYNAGTTHHILTCKSCKGLQCNGFLKVRCVASLKNQSIQPYAYRERVFVYPRYHRIRVDFCYEQGRLCGKKAAGSYCRRMGYLKAVDYTIENHSPQTQTLGDHSLCLGRDCKAFRSITCYR